MGIIYVVILYILGAGVVMILGNYQNLREDKLTRDEIIALSVFSWVGLIIMAGTWSFYKVSNIVIKIQNLLSDTIGEGKRGKIRDFYRQMGKEFTSRNKTMVFSIENNKLKINYTIFDVSNPLTKNTEREYTIPIKYELKEEQFKEYIKQQIPQEFL